MSQKAQTVLWALLMFGPMTAYYFVCWLRGKQPVNPYAASSKYKVEDPLDKLEFWESAHRRADGFGVVDHAAAVDDHYDLERVLELDAARRSDPHILAWEAALAEGRDVELEGLLASGSWRLARSMAGARERAALKRGDVELAALYRGYCEGIDQQQMAQGR